MHRIHLKVGSNPLEIWIGKRAKFFFFCIFRKTNLKSIESQFGIAKATPSNPKAMESNQW